MVTNKLYGAILGDLAGQPYEFPVMEHFPAVEVINLHNPDSHITDDTLMTLASASCMLGMFPSIEAAYKDMGQRYGGDYYGKMFKGWLQTTLGTIANSLGNGCMMRISPFMYLTSFKRGNLTDAIYETVIESCMCSHNHPKSIIASIKLTELYSQAGLRRVSSKFVTQEPLPFEKFEVGAKETIEFIEIAYWYSNSTHDTMKKVISCGGDTDTNASIIGELMNYTFNDITEEDAAYVESKLDTYQLNILHEFNKRF